jgi:predicted adenylyl cyclase CyaB
MGNAIEVEIKTLLGSREAAESLISRMREKDPMFTLQRKNNQLNHYFTGGSVDVLAKTLAQHVAEPLHPSLLTIAEEGRSHSVRTRKADNDVLIVIKATLDETTSSNGTARMEFETPVALSIDELDELILSAGFAYQAKWSRERHEYRYKAFNVAIDRNAGYGYLAEFERVLGAQEDFERVKGEIRDELESLGLEELNQERLARMFDHYNAHWQDYYGTDNTFTIY